MDIIFLNLYLNDDKWYIVQNNFLNQYFKHILTENNWRRIWVIHNVWSNVSYCEIT